MSKFDYMGKTELRAACKEAGITGYSKMDNAKMRAALEAKSKGAAKSASTKPAGEKKATNGLAASINGLMVANGHAKAPEMPKRSGKSTPAKPQGGVKIEKVREERNGVKRPSTGTLCRAVWDALDEMVAKGTQPTAPEVKKLAEEKGWNKNNASIEFYQWRKFNGITGRSK